MSKDLSTLLDHARLEDWEEVQDYCAKARHLLLDAVILIRPPPNGCEVFLWD